MVKRIFDLLLSCAALFVLAPLMGFLAVLIYVKLGSPVIFVQKRPGLHEKPFRLVKFRSMVDEKDLSGQPLPDGERLTPFGRFLRSSSLDELPELLNVLKGDMSFVGPRPLLMEYLTLYSEEQSRRHEVRPGITGWAQVHGRNAVDWPERLALDVWYIDNRSFLLDLKILYMTIRQVLGRQGVNQEGHATMRKFKGEGTGEDEYL